MAISLTPAIIELIAVLAQGTILQLLTKYPTDGPTEDEIRAQINIEIQRNQSLMKRLDALEGGD